MVETYKRILAQRTDIQEHLGILRGLAIDCSVVVEFGLRTGMAATAMLDGTKTKVLSYDINDCKDAVNALSRMAGGRFGFRKQSSLDADIPECDMLFIDSQHDYVVLSKELSLHHGKVKRWIAMHDTLTFGKKGMTAGDPGLVRAVDEFLKENQDWSLHLVLKNQNGFTLLKRREYEYV